MQIRRERYLDLLTSHIGNGMVKLVTGIRRCGKSYMLFKLLSEHILSNMADINHVIAISLDDRRNIELRNPDKILSSISNRISDHKTYYVMLDEVQLIDEFESVLNSLLHIPNVEVFATGSNSKFLSSDIITEFRGRGDEIRMHPLSFREFLQGFDGTSDEAWDRYCTYGGLPLVLSFKTHRERLDYLKNQFRSVYLNDLVERANIKNDAELEELLKILASSVGSLVNPTRLANTFKTVKRKTISDHTIKRFLDWLQDAFLLEKAEKYDIKGKKYIASPSKYYFEDIGLRNALLNFRQLEESRLMENIIYNELKARGFAVDVGMVEEFSRENGKAQKRQLEIDFVASNGSKKYYVQSVLRASDEEKLLQETRPFLRIDDNFKKILIVKDKILPRHDERGVTTLSLMDFLTDENCFDAE